MRTNKLLIFATVALLLINIALVYFLWNKKGAHPKKERSGDRGDWVVNELKFDENQKAEHKKLKDEHFSKIKPVFDSIASVRKQLYTLIKTSNPSDSLVNEYAQQIGNYHTRISQYTFDHFRKLRMICNPEQQVKLDTLVQKIVQDRRGKKPQQ